MGQHILPGHPPITVALRRSARASKLSLRVSRLDGRVTLTHLDIASAAVGLVPVGATIGS